MENRLQHILLRLKIATFVVAVAAIAPIAFADGAKKSKLRVNKELFDIGLVTGIINIENFPAEYLVGVNVTFKASEDFFLQYNYIQADISESSFEKNPAAPTLDLGDNRSFSHYDLLLGYNIFQGEFFASGGEAHLSSLYVVAGIGDTDFGGEENFTYTLGLGYQIEFFRRYLVRFDYRDYIYSSSLVVGDNENTVHNNQISVGVGYLF